MRRGLLALLVLLLANARAARADTLTVGLFAPTAPFPSTAARVELASRLGEHIAKVLGETGNGKVYARAGDFAAAVKKGEVTIALVDAAYLAASGGSYTVIAASVRGGETNHPWLLVARGADKISALKGKRIAVPGVGGREVDFVLNVMLGGEVGRDFFSAIQPSPDTASTLATLALGKADAAIVPTGVDLPAGTSALLNLPAISGPVLVVYGSITPARKAALVEAATTFKGDATLAGLRAADAEAVHQIARRFTVPIKRGPLAVPAIRLLVGELVEGRTFSIERTPVTSFTVSPGH